MTEQTVGNFVRAGENGIYIYIYIVICHVLFLSYWSLAVAMSQSVLQALVCMTGVWLKFTSSVTPRMGVAELLRRPTLSRGRKRPRAAVRLVGTLRAACRRSRLRVTLFCVFWFTCGCLVACTLEPLIFGTRDWLLFGSFLCGLFSHLNPLPGHRLVPESQVISRRTFLRARDLRLRDQ